MKNILAGEDDLTCVKEVIGWMVDTEVVTVGLPDQNLQELLVIFSIPEIQLHNDQKEL